MKRCARTYGYAFVAGTLIPLVGMYGGEAAISKLNPSNCSMEAQTSNVRNSGCGGDTYLTAKQRAPIDIK